MSLSLNGRLTFEVVDFGSNRIFLKINFVKEKAVFNWSGGKDSALALYHAWQSQDYSVDCLLTSINGAFKRVSMHGVREALLERQAQSLGLPLKKVYLSEQASMEEYNREMGMVMDSLKEEGYSTAVFGDIFLEDLKKYREERLATVGFSARFPIWQRNTTSLLCEFLDLGFKTILVSINAQLLDKSFAGRIIDRDFIKDLPKGIDVCGENGEFHTFVFDGPIFSKPVDFEKGEIIYREYNAPKRDTSDHDHKDKESEKMGFWFCELLDKS